MSRRSQSAKEFFISNEGDTSYADVIESLIQDIQLQRGYNSENMALKALQVLANSGEIQGFEDATGTHADFKESTDFWMTFPNGHRRRVQVKSSAHHIRVHSHEPKYNDISFLVVKEGDTVDQVADKIRHHILQRVR